MKSVILLLMYVGITMIIVGYMKNYYEPTETKLRTEQLEMTEYGLSQNTLVKWIQKNFN